MDRSTNNLSPVSYDREQRDPVTTLFTIYAYSYVRLSVLRSLFVVCCNTTAVLVLLYTDNKITCNASFECLGLILGALRGHNINNTTNRLDGILTAPYLVRRAYIGVFDVQQQ